MRCALFWDITQRKVVIPYRSFGTAYRSPKYRYRIATIRFIISQKSADLIYYAAGALNRAYKLDCFTEMMETETQSVSETSVDFNHRKQLSARD
jgi:hypothetical protein